MVEPRFQVVYRPLPSAMEAGEEATVKDFYCLSDAFLHWCRYYRQDCSIVADGVEFNPWQRFYRLRRAIEQLDERPFDPHSEQEIPFGD